MAVIGDLVVNLSTNAKRFTSGLQSAASGLGSFQGMIAGATAAVTNFGLNMARDAVRGMMSFGVQLIKLAADAETTRIQFEVLTGSLEKGVGLFKDVEAFAGRTSFNLDSAGDAAKKLLASGVQEGDIMSTMQLLGDLAMGDANKLGFLSKAYTDVLNKGKLQGQELRQFAENGVGLASALSKTLGMSTQEVLKLSEAGGISFGDMQDALRSLTGEGGRFHGMMERINKTLTGQWNSLIESIEKIGRGLGDVILPHLTKIVAEVNKFAQGFADLENKAEFIGDLFAAGVDLGIEHIKESWRDMLSWMIDESKMAAFKMAEKFTLVGQFRQIGNLVNAGIEGGKGLAQNDGVANAQARMDEVLGRLQRPAANVPAFVGPQQGGFAQGGFAQGVLDNMREANAPGLIRDFFGKLVGETSSLMSQIGMAGNTKLQEGILQAGWLKSTAMSWLTDTRPGKTRTPKESAQAAEKGSAEAIRIALSGRNKTKEDKMLKAQQDDLKIQKDMLALQKQQANMGNVEELVANF